MQNYYKMQKCVLFISNMNYYFINKQLPYLEEFLKAAPNYKQAHEDFQWDREDQSMIMPFPSFQALQKAL